MNTFNARDSNPAPRRPDIVDETSDESFPASDPPSWSLLHAGAPRQPVDEASAAPRRGEHAHAPPTTDEVTDE